MNDLKVLMVCLGNICRSPLAQGILESKINDHNLNWTIDSAGTSSFHSGEQADPRSIAIGKEYGIDISHQKSRAFTKQDFEDYDLILAMDQSNYRDIVNLADKEADQKKVHLILNFVFPDQNRAVPDPYYNDGFDHVYQLLDSACDQLIERYSTSFKGS